MMQNNTQKVSLIILIFKFNLGPNNPRYKTTLCKHFSTPQGCSYGDKCQFAHGNKELRLNNNQGFPQGLGMPEAGNKMQNSIVNYKIVKCKNWEKDGTCKYGVHCTFAHGDKDLRNKSQNLYQMNNSMMMIPMMNEMYPIPMMMPAGGMDMSQMPQMMAPPNINQNQFMMMNMMPPVQDGMNNNNDNDNAEPKVETNQQ